MKTSVSDKDREAMIELALKEENSDIGVDYSLLGKEEEDLEQTLSSLLSKGMAIVSQEDDAYFSSSRSLRHLSEKMARPKKQFIYDKDIRGLYKVEEIKTVREYIENNGLYYMKTLASSLSSDHRLKHSVSVANLSYGIATSNHLLNTSLAYYSGLLHDIAKNTPMDEQKRVIEEKYPEFKDFPEWSFHQFVGAEMALSQFPTEDIFSILAAGSIRRHATGCRDMNRLDKIIYAADKIEPLRGYDSSALIEECMKDIDKGFAKVLSANKEYMESKGYKVDNPWTKGCFEQYL